ncbi:MAG: PASTA domain-containing protein, partial [Firmicutes bacterium]|nr:PASTA domain-containing protein [Bacillota bacterium]
ADEMCEIMESVVSEGGGGNAKVAGYRIGGKTGTANKPKAGGYSEDTYSSFIGLAPMDDPQVAILLIVDTPVGVKYGSTTAAPGVKLILEDTLRYLNIQPTYTEEELKAIESNLVTVPDLTGESVESALGILGGQKLKATLSLNQDLGTAGEVVVDQYPKPGERVEKDSTITVYYDKVAPVEEPEGKDLPLEAQ